MKRLKLLTRTLLAAPVVAGLVMLSAHAGSAAYNFDGNPPDGILITGGNPVGWYPWGGNPDGYLSLTDAVNSQSTVVIFPDFDGGMIVSAFTFVCDVRIGNPTGNAGRPADGFSISYARATDPLLAHDGDGNYFAMAGQHENGTSTGVVISFDAWSGNALPDTADVQGLIVRVDNVTVLKREMPFRHGNATDITSLQTGPFDVSEEYPNGSGMPDGLAWVKLEVELNESAQLTVKFKGTTLLDKYQTDFKPSAGRLVMAGRTGGANQNQHVDNVVISTTPANKATITGVTGNAVGFTATIEDVGDSVLDPATLVVKLNGTAVAPAVSKTGIVTTLVYNILPATLASGSSNTIELDFKDTRGLAIKGAKTFVVGAYALIPPSYAAAAGQVDKTKPGFATRMTQIPIARYPTDENYTANAERQLAGGYIDPATSQPYANLTDMTLAVGGLFIDEDVINWNWEATEYGNFTTATGFTDEVIPGIPGTTGSTDHTSAEVMTYLDLKAGLYRFGVNSDDGFKASAARDVRDTLGVTLGSFNGGRGASDTLFDVAVTQDGAYPIRVSWWNGTGGANLEFFCVDAAGTRTLINDLAAAAPIKAYRSSTINLPRVVSVTPGVDQPGTWPNTDVVVEIVDGATQVAAGSVQMTFDGAAVTPAVTKTGTRTKVTLPSSGLLASGSVHRVGLSFADTGTPAKTYDYTWQFTVAVCSTLPLASASPVGSGDAAKPGFTARIYQVESRGTTVMGTLTAAAEQALAGILGPNVADLSLATGGLFDVPGVVNWNQDAPAATGNFTIDNGYEDAPIPGIPGTGLYPTDSIAAELVTYVEFPTAGFYVMGVNSDDGFKVTAADTPPANNQALVVTAPASIAGAYYALSSGSDGGGIAKPITAPITGKLVYANPPLGGADLINAAEVNGNICMFDRGTYAFTDKLGRALKAGAIAVVMVNNRCPGKPDCTPDAAGDWPIVMGGTYFDIPAVMISTTDGTTLKSGFAQGDVMVSITPDATPALGQFNGGRGVADTTFTLFAPQAGVYPFRCVWYEGGGGAAVEWFTVAADGAKTLLNDNKAGALKAYRARTVAPPPPTIAIAIDGSNAVITFTGTLQSADEVTGTWTDVAGASPKTVPLSGAAKKFYRAKAGNQ